MTKVRANSTMRAQLEAPIKFTLTKLTGTALAFSVVTACTTPAPPPAPPTPPPPAPAAVERIPYRPLPPGGASYVMEIPGKDESGHRTTISKGVSGDERVWHFRSAWNVAALNCTAAQYQPILTSYSAYIKDHARALKSVNDRIDREYRRKLGARRAGILEREGHMTAVYNYFALPPARAGFCRAALDLSNRYSAVPPSDPIAFANANFANLEAPFENFFTDYERYQRLSAEWDDRYGERYGASQPGWVAVQEARAKGAPVPSVEDDPESTLAEPTTVARTVADQETGADVPVVPVQENFVSQPVTQPVASDGDGDSSS